MIAIRNGLKLCNYAMHSSNVTETPVSGSPSLRTELANFATYNTVFYPFGAFHIMFIYSI